MLIAHRLLPGFKVDNAQPTMGKANHTVRMRPDALPVRPSMLLEAVHHLK